MDISNIDDMLHGTVGGNKTEPEKVVDDTPEDTETGETDSGDVYGLSEEESDEPETHSSDESDEGDAQDKTSKKLDEYGNEEDTGLTEKMQKRLKKLKADNDAQLAQAQSEIAQLRAQLAQQGASSDVQQAAKDFKYDPNDDGSWQEQLAEFVRHTVRSDEQKKIQEAQHREELADQAEFRARFNKGMERFDDFVEVVDGKPIDPDMAAALRGISDPAAFIYAAAKRMPQELERISKLKNRHERYSEMIRLEGKLRQSKRVTEAPRALGRTKEDANVPQPKAKKEESIEDLIAKNDAKKLAQVRGRTGYRGR